MFFEKLAKYELNSGCDQVAKGEKKY